MKELDDVELKEEIDQISKRIDAIVQQMEKLVPTANENPGADRE
jgi:hypothetical protein